MKLKSLLQTLSFLVVAIALFGCGLLATPTPESPSIQDLVLTQAAQTVQVQLTQGAIQTLLAQVTQSAATPTITLPPTNTPTLPPSSTPLPPTATPPPPTPTEIPIPCDRGQFVKDVTVPDGTVYAPGSEFTKTWRLKNTGTCTWDQDYDLVFSSGSRLGGERVVPMPERVRPGETVNLSVDLVAPEDDGHYRGYWMLRNDSGEVFGIGDDADKAFWVDIRVALPANPSFNYDFAANFCNATWRNSEGNLPCPGSTSSSDGSVVVLESPTLENGRTENEPALWTRPEQTNGGYISGIFPRYRVGANQHFVADIGCLEDSTGCDVTFRLEYVREGKVYQLGEWDEVYDGSITRLDIDVSYLAGDRVNFILTVIANSKPSKANAFWLVPSIRTIKTPSTEG